MIKFCVITVYVYFSAQVLSVIVIVIVFVRIIHHIAHARTLNFMSIEHERSVNQVN